MHLTFTLLIKYLKNKSFIFKCVISVNGLLYKGKGYYDSGNMLTYNDIPVIFIKGVYHNENGEVIHINTINDESYTYLSYKGLLKISKKNINVYVVFINEKINFNNCNILLNKYVL